MGESRSIRFGEADIVSRATVAGTMRSANQCVSNSSFSRQDSPSQIYRRRRARIAQGENVGMKYNSISSMFFSVLVRLFSCGHLRDIPAAVAFSEQCHWP